MYGRYCVRVIVKNNWNISGLYLHVGTICINILIVDGNMKLLVVIITVIFIKFVLRYYEYVLFW